MGAGAWRLRGVGITGVTALVLGAGIAAGSAPATDPVSAKPSQGSRAKITRIAIADVEFRGGNKRIGVEVAARYRPFHSGHGAATFVHRFAARAKAEIGSKTFAADPEPDARLKSSLTTDGRRLPLEAHLFFSRAESRGIRQARKARGVNFVGAVTYSVDRNADGTSDASFSDQAEDDTPQVVTRGAPGGGLATPSVPCSVSTEPAKCTNVVSNPVTAPHFWATEKLVPPDCPSGTEILEYGPDNEGEGDTVYHVTNSPSDSDHFTVNTIDEPTLYVTDDNLHHPVVYQARYGCSPGGN